MRKIVNVIGVGKRKQGVSKSGNSYDFTPVAISFDDSARWADGQRCAEINVNTADLNDAGHAQLKPGDCIEVVMHEDFRRGGFVLDAVL